MPGLLDTNNIGTKVILTSFLAVPAGVYDRENGFSRSN